MRRLFGRRATPPYACTSVRLRFTSCFAVLGGALVLGGCGEPAPKRSARTQVSGKDRLYGDPGLVPTREGERARAELALRHDLQEAVAALPQVRRATAMVRISEGDVAGAVLILEASPEHAQTAARASRVIAQQVLGPVGAAKLVVQSYDTGPLPSAGPAQSTDVRWPLLFAILGLGFSIGLLFDRTRQRARRRTRGTRSPDLGA